jgi:hypothetical protein
MRPKLVIIVMVVISRVIRGGIFYAMGSGIAR